MLTIKIIGIEIKIVDIKNIVQYNSRYITQSVSNLKILI